MKFARRHVLFGLLAVYVSLRLIGAAGMHTEGFLLDALERRTGQVLPARVCYAVQADERGYLSSLYAAAPRVLVREGALCDYVLSP